jgi:hypothetical protein
MNQHADLEISPAVHDVLFMSHVMPWITGEQSDDFEVIEFIYLKVTLSLYTTHKIYFSVFINPIWK